MANGSQSVSLGMGCHASLNVSNAKAGRQRACENAFSESTQVQKCGDMGILASKFYNV